MRVDLKKNTRVEKERTLTSCDVNRCLHFIETRFRSKVVVCWLPNIAKFFSSLARLIEDLERQLSSASYDSSEFRHILAAVHLNFNLQREVKCRERDGTERWRVSYPKFKNGEATVRNVKITPDFGKCQRDTEIYNLG